VELGFCPCPREGAGGGNLVGTGKLQSLRGRHFMSDQSLWDLEDELQTLAVTTERLRLRRRRVAFVNEV
jgi:hypothetical protein